MFLDLLVNFVLYYCTDNMLCLLLFFLSQFARDLSVPSKESRNVLFILEVSTSPLDSLHRFLIPRYDSWDLRLDRLPLLRTLRSPEGRHSRVPSHLRNVRPDDLDEVYVPRVEVERSWWTLFRPRLSHLSPPVRCDRSTGRILRPTETTKPRKVSNVSGPNESC